MLRGRGGTEAFARTEHPVGSSFVLLDGQPVAIDPAAIAATETLSLATIGLADSEPVVAAISDPGATLRPLTPVHPRARQTAEGGMILSWTRRARGAWTWPDGIEAPLNEQREAYLVGLGDTGQPALRWELDGPRLELSAATFAQISVEYSGQSLWVRQIGSHAASQSLLLTTLD